MGKALYRTYRSKKLSEIVGQEHITTALDHALKKGTVSHAYLFTGPRGVGKTSIARILAHEINGLPYDETQNHLDIIEIDAASNRRIDEIRDLRDKVHIAPSSSKYKVYIIDEVHMLTKEAFNALLKTLEEPPAHVVFILATTEVHKLPETIISRTQRYSFKPVDMPKVVAHLRSIAESEKIDISDDALGLIAAHGEGSFRDSISLLDQVRNKQDKVELSDVQSVLGIAPQEMIETTLKAIRSHDSLGVAQNLQKMHDQGFEASQIAKQLSKVLRAELIEGTSTLSHEISIQLLSQLVQVPASPDPRIALQIALLDATLKGEVAPVAAPQKTMSEDVATVAPAIEIKPKRSNPVVIEEPVETVLPAAKDEDEMPDFSDQVTGVRIPSADDHKKGSPLKLNQDDDSVDVDSDIELDGKAWDLILNAIKKKHNTIYSLVNMANVHFAPGSVTLEFGYSFHQKRLNESRNKEVLSEVISGVTGSTVQIKCIVGEGKPAPKPALPPADGEVVHAVAEEVPEEEPQAKPADIAAISNIFGGAEVLES
jgi:DNA polymerase-3 subunit gamma/tau